MQQQTRAQTLIAEAPKCYDSDYVEWVGKLEAELMRLDALVNNAHVENFFEAARFEAAHQIERWGEVEQREKSSEMYFWLVGYLAGKALRASIDGDSDKARHHTISSAAALAHWHRNLQLERRAGGAGNDPDMVKFAEMLEQIEPTGWIRYDSHNAGGPEPEDDFTHEFMERREGPPLPNEGWVPVYIQQTLPR